MTKEDIKRIIVEHRDILAKYQVKSISLFGSYVRNQQNEKSDIDFLVEFDRPSYDNFIHLVFDLEGLLKKEVSVVTPKGISPYVLPFVLKEVEEIARG
ncbi:MAG: nucleotidyltransferase family protein [bacterium]